MSDPQAHFIQLLQEHCPGLTIKRAEVITTGQYNLVLTVNGEWIFRFPRYAVDIDRLAREVRLLERLRGRLPLSIPDPVYVHLEGVGPGEAFVGYRRLPGEPLYRPVVDAARADGSLNQLASDLADFLYALHEIPGQSLGLALDVADGSQQWHAMYAEVQARLFPAMRADARQSVAQHFETFLKQADLLPEERVLRHGDLGGSNILYDPMTHRLGGVIDFSECALGDPVVDLAAISTLGEDFLQCVLARYTSDAASRAMLLDRVRFYRGTFALQEALAGLENGDQAAYRSGMEPYI